MAGDKTLGPSQRATLSRALAVDVPAEGRTGPVPEWPGTRKPSKANAALWERLWRLPVAVAWETLQIPIETVARYVVSYNRALSDHKWAGAAARLEKDLWLTPEAMRMGRIRVSDADEDADSEAEVTELDEARRRRIASG